MAYFIEIEWPTTGLTVSHPFIVSGRAWDDSEPVDPANLPLDVIPVDFWVNVICENSTPVQVKFMNTDEWAVPGINPDNGPGKQLIAQLKLAADGPVVAACIVSNVTLADGNPDRAPAIEIED